LKDRVNCCCQRGEEEIAMARVQAKLEAKKGQREKVKK